MRILVTGASGFVGQHVIPLLLNRGHAVTAVARDEARARNFPWFKHVQFIATDIHLLNDDPFRLFGQPQAVMHLAWSGLPHYKELFHFENNLHADYRFLKTLIEAGVNHLLVTGTCSEYGMQSGCLTEDMSTQPSNPYGLAKDTLRKFLQSLQQKRSFTLQWARLFYMYGPGQNSNSLFAQLDRAISSKNKEVGFNMSNGEQLRDYLPVGEVARRLVTLIEHSERAGVINISSGDPISVRNLVEQYLKKSGADIPLNLGHYPCPDYEPMAFWGGSNVFKKNGELS